jgi:hypothetical protein
MVVFSRVQYHPDKQGQQFLCDTGTSMVRRFQGPKIVIFIFIITSFYLRGCDMVGNVGCGIEGGR